MSNQYLKFPYVPCLIAMILLAGCNYLPFIQRIHDDDKQNEEHSRILSYYVVHNAPDHLALAIKYFYDGSQGEAVSIGAITRVDGWSDGHWAYRSDRVLKGEHWAKVRIGMSSTAPAYYDSDEIEFEIYKDGSSVFVQSIVPFKKKWQRLKNPSQCHLNWGRGCGG